MTAVYRAYLWTCKGLAGTVANVVADNEQIAKRKSAVQFLKRLGPNRALHQLKQSCYGYGHPPRGLTLRVVKQAEYDGPAC